MLTYLDLENLDISKKDYGKIFKYLLDVVLINEKFNDKDMLIEIVKKVILLYLNLIYLNQKIMTKITKAI